MENQTQFTEKEITAIRAKINEVIAENAKVFRSKNIQARMDCMTAILETFNGVKFEFVGDKPNAGMSYCVKSYAKNTVLRINIRCGYSRHNYAPCFELTKI